MIRVSASLEQTTLQRIIDMVNQEVDHKSKYVRAADQIVRWFVPFVIGFALTTACVCFFAGVVDKGQTILQTAMQRAISILLISCPCAIGIAAPLAESYLLNALAKIGVLVRNRGCLAFLGQETLFIFDKTGTVTEGRFTVQTRLDCLELDEKMALKGLIAQSTHPIALALQSALLCAPSPFEKIEEKIGKGIQGNLQGKKYYLGSASFFHEVGLNVPSPKVEDGPNILTTVYFAKEKECLAAIVLGDQLRSGVQEFIRHLFPLKTLLVSGDAEAPVKRVAQACQIHDWKSGYNPLKKKMLIDDLKKGGEIIAMLGDGVNDAPALTAAHIGIAVVSASDISIQVSDLLLTTKGFQSLALLRQLALKGKKIIRQNLFWAFFYNCVGLGIAAAGLMTPLFAACAMVMSSLIVLMNAQRISSQFPST